MKYFLILLFVFCPFYLTGQEPESIDNSVSGNIEIVDFNQRPEKVVFAEPFKLSFVLPQQATFDGENTSQKDFEILALSQNKQNPLLTEITVLPLNLEVSTLTALGFVTADGKKIHTKPLEINIEERPSKTKGLIDIRGPYRPSNIVFYILFIVLLGLIIYAVVRVIKRAKKPASLNLTPYQKQEQPMHEIALSQLDILIQSDLWERSEYKIYYSEISDILRQFLAARFNFGAQEMTDRELFKKLKTIPDFKFDFNVFQRFQQAISLVKFARVIPTVEERDKALNTAKEIILENKETDLSRYQKNNNAGGKNEKYN